MPFSSTALNLGIGKYSYSKLNVAKKCGYQFTKRFLEKAKTTNEVDAGAAVVGTSVHWIMEKTLLDFQVSRERPDRARVQQVATGFLDRALVKFKVTEKEALEVRTIQSATESMLCRLLDFMGKNAAQFFVEKSLAVDSSYRPLNPMSPTAFFMGVLDLAFVSRSGQLFIIDHKTGYKSLKGHESQLLGYEILGTYAFAPEIEQTYGIKIKSIKAGLNFVKDEELLWTPEVSVDQVKRERTELFEAWLNGLVETGVEGKVNRDKHCNWCGYRSYCGSKVGTRKKKATEEAALSDDLPTI